MAKRTSKSSGTQAGLPMAQQQIEIKSLAAPDGAPEILIDGINGVFVAGGVVRFHCFSVHIQNGAQNPAVVLRLAMGLPTMVAVQEMFLKLVVEFEKNGIISKTPA